MPLYESCIKKKDRTHNSWWAALDCNRNKSALDGQPILLGEGAAGQEGCRGAISSLRGIASCGRSTNLESRLELGEALRLGASTDAFILINRLALRVLNANNFAFEKTSLLGLRRLLMGCSCEGILLLARDAEFGSDVLGCDTHRNHAIARFGVVDDAFGHVLQVYRSVETPHGHRFDTSADASVDSSLLNGAGDSGDGLEAGGALAIDGHERNVGRNATEHLSQARANCASAALKHVSDNNISDHVSLGAGTLYGLAQHSSKQFFGGCLSKSTFLGLGQRGTNLLFAQRKWEILYDSCTNLSEKLKSEVSNENKDVPQRR